MKEFRLLRIVAGLIILGFILSASNVYAFKLNKKSPTADITKFSKEGASSSVWYNLGNEKRSMFDWINLLRKREVGGPGWIVVNDKPDTYHGYVYDNALAIIAYTMEGLRYGDPEEYAKARDILSFFLRYQRSDGSFNDMMYINGETDPGLRRHSGNQAWVLYAINFYMYKTGDLGPNNAYFHMATEIAEWLMDRQDSDGGIKGGLEANGNAIPWTSTEHNIDSYFAFRLFYYLSQSLEISNFPFDEFNEEYLATMNGCKNWLLSEGWNSYQGRFNTGENDYTEYLDPQTWGSLFLHDIGEFEMQENLILEYAKPTFAVTTSRGSGDDVEEYSGFKEHVNGNHWLEGTMQMSVALLRMGEWTEARSYIYEVVKSDDPDHASGDPNDDNDGDGGAQYYMTGNIIGEQAGTVLWEIFAINEHFDAWNIVFFPVGYSPYDLNCDGQVNLSDAGIVSIAFSDPNPDYSQGTIYSCSDYNHDRNMDLVDVQHFVSGFYGNDPIMNNYCCVTVPYQKSDFKTPIIPDLEKMMSLEKENIYQKNIKR